MQLLRGISNSHLLIFTDINMARMAGTEGLLCRITSLSIAVDKPVRVFLGSYLDFVSDIYQKFSVHHATCY